MASIREKIGNFIAGKSRTDMHMKSLISEDNIERQPGLNLYNTQIPDLAALWGQYTDSNLATLFHEMGEVFAPVDIIASAVADGKVVVKKVSDDSIVTDNKYLNVLLSTPNPLQSWSELVYQLVAYELVCGKSYLYGNTGLSMNLNYRNVCMPYGSLINLQADVVYIQTDPFIKTLSATKIEDLIKSYVVPEGMNGLVHITPDKVLYTKHCSLYASDLNIRGRSPLLSAQKAITNLCAVYEARNVIYTKRGALGFVVSKKEDGSGRVPLTPKEKDEVNKEYNKSYGLTGSKSPVGVLGVPVDFVKVAATISELEPFTETEADAEVIFSIYKVPMELGPNRKGATFENQNQARKRVYEAIAIPRAKALYKSLTTWLKLDEVGLYLDVDFSHIHVLQENLKEKSAVDWRNNETARIRFNSGIITLNDWRKSCGFEVVPNAIYSKLLYDMSPEELTKVEQVMKLSVGNSSKASGEGGNATDGTASDTPGN